MIGLERDGGFAVANGDIRCLPETGMAECDGVFSGDIAWSGIGLIMLTMILYFVFLWRPARKDVDSMIAVAHESAAHARNPRNTLSGQGKTHFDKIMRGYYAGSGQEWIRTTEGVSQQIYSLPRLATPEPAR